MRASTDFNEKLRRDLAFSDRMPLLTVTLTWILSIALGRQFKVFSRTTPFMPLSTIPARNSHSGPAMSVRATVLISI